MPLLFSGKRMTNMRFNTPTMSALRRTADAQASLESQFDRHKCELDSSRYPARVIADVLVREEPDEDGDDNRREDDDDEGTLSGSPPENSSLGKHRIE
jgi:hypothetical protein